MLKHQQNKFTMAKNAAAFLGENEQIISAIPELNSHLTILRTKCNEIENKDTERITIRQGMYLNKQSEKNKSINAALGISGAVYAYAKKTKDIELSEKSYIIRSDLMYMRDTELTAKLRFINELASENLQSLEPYGITEQKLNTFTTKIETYEKAVSDSGESFAVRKGSLKTIKDLFGELNEILTATDKLTDSFIEEYPEFVNNYRILRRIKKFGVRYRKVPVGQSLQPDPTPGIQTTS